MLDAPDKHKNEPSTWEKMLELENVGQVLN